MAKASTGQKALLLAMVFVALMVPPVVLLLIGVQGLTSACIYGGMVALVASFYDFRLAAALSLIAGLAAVVAVLLSPYALAGAIFMALIAGGAAFTARQGLHSPVMIVPMFICFMVVSPPEITNVTASVGVAVISGITMAGCGLWVTGAARVVLGASPRLPRKVRPLSVALWYAGVMALVVGAATWTILTYVPTHRGAWLILTLIVVLQPSSHDTLKKTLHRLGGTIAGGLISLVFLVIDLPSAVHLAAAALLLYVALLTRFVLGQPYWLYVLVLTPAIVLVSTHGPDTLDIVTARVEFTLLGGAIAIVIALVAKWIILRVRAHHGDVVASPSASSA